MFSPLAAVWVVKGNCPVCQGLVTVRYADTGAFPEALHRSIAECFRVLLDRQDGKPEAETVYDLTKND
jgi:hypothetical protein